MVDMRLLRQRLGRKQPSAELCQAELGRSGPIVGTIHASKGREADTVHLMLPFAHNQSIDQDEEARVVFVGATRGRSRLLIGRGYRQYGSRIEDSGRAYCLKISNGRPRAQVEIGYDTDITAGGLAGRSFFASPGEVHRSQTRIRGLPKEPVSVLAESDREAGFAYRVREDGQGQCLAVLSMSVNADLFSIADAVSSPWQNLDFSGLCSFRTLALRWPNDGFQERKTANRAGTTPRNAPKGDSWLSSAPLGSK